jgi:hypothetical protein
MTNAVGRFIAELPGHRPPNDSCGRDTRRLPSATVLTFWPAGIRIRARPLSNSTTTCAGTASTSSGAPREGCWTQRAQSTFAPTGGRRMARPGCSQRTVDLPASSDVGPISARPEPSIGVTARPFVSHAAERSGAWLTNGGAVVQLTDGGGTARRLSDRGSGARVRQRPCRSRQRDPASVRPGSRRAGMRRRYPQPASRCGPALLPRRRQCPP